MNSVKNIVWTVILFVISFAVTTLVTANLSADVDGTDDYGFPLRFSRTGGRFLDMNGESTSADDFYMRRLVIDLVVVLVLVLFFRFLFLRYRAGKKRSQNLAQ